MSRHIIHQQAIEIGATDRNSAQPVFLEISRLFNNRAKDAAGYVLDKYDQEDELIKIDVLEVDIGTIPFPFSEESFVKIYSEKLEEALAGVIKKQLQLAESKAKQNEPGRTKRTLLQLLEQFLLTGTMAWWAGREELKDPVRVFKTLQEKEMPLLQAMITRLFPEDRVRKRLVYSFIEETIKTVIGMIQPAEKEFIVRYHARVSHLQTENRFLRTDTTGFRKVLWLFILDFLADQSGSRFNRKMFVRFTLNAIAQRFNMRFDELLFFFSEALKAIPENFRKTENLLSLVEEIAFEQSQQEHNHTSSLRIHENHSENPEWLRDGQAVFFFLLNGYFPMGFQPEDKADLNAEFIHAVEHYSSYVRLFFLKHGRSSLVRKRILTYVSEESLKALIRLVEPSGTELIISYAAFMTQFQRKVRFVLAEESQFSESLWDQILVALASERGAAFHAKSFLAANLEALARRYTIDLLRLQAVLVQGAVQQDSVSAGRSVLFSLFSEIFSENSTAKQKQVQKTEEASGKSTEQDQNPESALSLPELLKHTTAATDTLQTNFLLHAVLYVLESGELPEWSAPGSLSVEAFIGRMRITYPNELRTGFLYASKAGKTGLYFLHRYAPLFKTHLVFLFENAFPDKLLLFFQELQKLYPVPDVIFAQGLMNALCESSDAKPDLPVFFAYLLKQVERMHGKEAVQATAFQSHTFTSIKGNSTLQQAFDKAIQEQAYRVMSSGTEYSAANFRQALALSLSDGRAMTESELPGSVVQWIRYYATSKQLPSYIRLPQLFGEKKFVAWSLEFLFRSHKHTLQELFANARFTGNELALFSDLLQHQGSGMQVRYFLEEQSRKLLIADEASLAGLSLDNPESWKWLMQKLTEQASQSPVQAKLMALMKQESSRSLMARYAGNDALKYVFEKENQSGLWTWYRYFEEVSLVVASGQFERQQFRIKLVDFFLMLLSTQTYVQHPAEFALRFTAFLLSKPDEVLEVVRERIANRSLVAAVVLSENASVLLKHLSAQMRQASLRNEAAKAIEAQIRTMEKDLHFTLGDEEKEVLEEEVRKKNKEAGMPLEEKALALGEQVYIRNAGMILLHPFLSTLFARAGLTADGVFTGKEAQAKAVQLLQYAVTGAEQSPEHELVLNKLLSGLKPEEVPDGTAELKPEEKELITGMIHAIMMQWDKMKNTSLDGFRNSFLMREGYVFQNEESWVLRVEQRGYDVILQTLPWSFGMIKFSWMTKPLIVEWN